MSYTINVLAQAAGVSVRTLHYYDQIGLLRPKSRLPNGYRLYSQDDALRLQQVLFFRELGFELAEISKIMVHPDFNLLQTLEAHRAELEKKARRTKELLETVDKTIMSLKGEMQMQIRDYYQGFSAEEVEKYREEARRRWGNKVVEESEAKVLKMGKEQMATIQAEFGAIFKTIADNMSKGHDSPEVQAQVVKWRRWLENFAHYSDEAVLGLGRMYSQDERFAAFFRKYHRDLPGFLTKAIEHYSKGKKQEGEGP